MLLNKIIETFLEKQRASEFALLNKYAGNPPALLTDEQEIMTICVAFGAALDYTHANHSINISTKHPVGAFWDGTRFHLYIHQGVKNG